MDKLPDLGKITPEFFNRVIYPRLGADDPTILVKPQHGVDFGVVDLGEKVMVLSTDPFFIAHELGMERAAWFALHIIASDVAVSGIRPRHLSVDLNLPPEMSEKDLEKLWETVDSECNKLRISVVTGHTARYAGCTYPMVGGATIIGVGSREELIIPNPLVGDAIIVSKGPAVETTGLMAAYFPDVLEKAYGSDFVRKARDIFYQMSTVKDARIAAETGGVTAMHDATECGVLGGLYEMAQRGNVGMRVELDHLLIQDIVAKTCAAFQIEPTIAISEGTLLATVRPEKADAVIKALEHEGIPACIAGEVVPREEGLKIVEGGQSRPLKHPRIDPFWGAFEAELKRRA